jgi:HPt (histidine-containing phosphotransfer) domain-containing protein
MYIADWSGNSRTSRDPESLLPADATHPTHRDDSNYLMEVAVLAEIESTLVVLANDLGPETVADILELYIVDSQRHVVDIRKGLSGADAAIVRRAAHTLKSTAATIGAMALANTCIEIERLARENKLDQAAKLYDQLARQEVEARRAVNTLQPKFTIVS